MRVGVLTKEYPPEVYGGAGVHVEFLVRELRRLIEVDVHCWGAPRNEPGVRSYEPPKELTTANPALQTLGVDLEIAQAVQGADLLHSHTWYANLGGVLGAQLHGVPHILTAHSLEPSRPWKAEQLGGGYRVSSWAERQAYESADAVIAVSHAMVPEMLAAYPFLDPARVHVIHNGIDTTLYAPTRSAGLAGLAERFGIDADRPSVLFVGRITRQKGVAHLLRAAADFDPDIQLVLCAGAPDTNEIAVETADLVETLSRRRSGVSWIRKMLPRPELVELLTMASVFICPSIYEPLGIVNLEAMACETAVVASAVGGIPEVVDDGVTGVLVPYSARAGRQFENDLAAAVNALVRDPARTAAMGAAGRERAVREFSWPAIAQQTVELYSSILAG